MRQRVVRVRFLFCSSLSPPFVDTPHNDAPPPASLQQGVSFHPPLLFPRHPPSRARPHPLRASTIHPRPPPPRQSAIAPRIAPRRPASSRPGNPHSNAHPGVVTHPGVVAHPSDSLSNTQTSRGALPRAALWITAARPARRRRRVENDEERGRAGARAPLRAPRPPPCPSPSARAQPLQAPPPSASSALAAGALSLARMHTGASAALCKPPTPSLPTHCRLHPRGAPHRSTPHRQDPAQRRVSPAPLLSSTPRASNARSTERNGGCEEPRQPRLGACRCARAPALCPPHSTAPAVSDPGTTGARDVVKQG
ncbi:hypothetical protein PLICRDRAFT_176523 [Plicaturopsis crispa FD-325 SS-3]|nr:hypothetical protein PLICRDRAFT_176523 [Plicaturopsis crispa FD-325 SS-3]